MTNQQQKSQDPTTATITTHNNNNINKPINITTNMLQASTIHQIIAKQTNVRAQVFRDANPPTMDVDTYLELQRQRGFFAK